MSNGTIPQGDKSALKEVIAVLFLVSGLTTVTIGLGIWLGKGAVMTFWGLVLTGLGATLGLSQTGKG
jgi:hypothetical protein